MFFLHRDLEEEIYMEAPPRYIRGIEANGIQTKKGIVWPETIT